jgi:gamma-glutamyltranspeptidase/glutathione hydrolase
MAPHVPVSTKHAPTGMVCSVDHLASAAGVEMLRRGGSAADAAIATNAVLAVTSQHLCGMGGDLFALVHRPGDGTPAALNASGRSGSGADAETLRAEGHDRMPFTGDIRSVPVPGCVDGWHELHRRFGRLALSEVLEPAIDYAELGFPASPTLVASARQTRGWTDADDFAGLERPGQRVTRPGVGRALRAIVEGGRAGFYAGEFGRNLVELGRGHYDEADLLGSDAAWVQPLGVEVAGRTVWTIPPNSQGFLTPAAWWIANEAGFDRSLAPDDPAWAHLLVEAARQAGFDRLDVLHEGADGESLVAPVRLAPRAAAIRPDRAADLGPEAHHGGGTTYLCAVDGDRMGVSLIQSNASGFGSGLVVPGVRIFLQNRGIGFSLEPGHPAEYGPGRRPPHTLCPALVTRPDGSLDAVLGTMGGDTQPQILLQLLARLAAGESPADAVAAGRWGLHTALEGGTGFDTWRERGRVVVRVEGHAPAAWDEGLRARGHVVERTAAFDHGFGHAQLIQLTDDGMLAAGSDPRPRTGAAIAF